MFDLQDKIALVTGASGGIGAEIAKALHAQGATVVLHGTRIEKLESLKVELGDRVFVVTANLVNRDAAAGLIDRASKAAGGPITILVNNAGITRDNILMRMKNDEWDSVIDTNLSSVFRLSKACLRGMTKAKWGRIVTITSVVGSMGNAGQANYSAAKAGMIGLTKSLAREFAARSVTVNAIAPGFIDTDMTSSLDDRIKEVALTQVPLKRFGCVEDISEMAAFLCSDKASYVTGQVFTVDGGMVM